MPFAKASRAVPAHLQHFGNRRRLSGDDTVIGRETIGDLSNTAHVHTVMIPSGQQGGSRRRTERGGVKLIKFQPCRRDLIDARTWDLATER